MISKEIYFFTRWSGGVFRSTDYGTTWDYVHEQLGGPEFVVFEKFRGKDSDLLSAAGSFIGVMASYDKGASWETIAEEFKGKPIKQIAFDGSSLYVVVYGEGVYRAKL
jgi:photosystem II stability/assembly factor-like uncharacterized protein